MSDENKPSRKPFGERDEQERSRPFGANPRRRDDDPDRLAPTAPYPERPKPAPPPHDPDATSPNAPYPWADKDEAPIAEEPTPTKAPEPDPAALSWDELIREVSDDELTP